MKILRVLQIVIQALSIAFLLGCGVHRVEKPEAASGCARFVAALEVVDEILGEDITGHSVDCRELERSEFISIASTILEEEATPEELQIEERVFKHLGLIPKSYQYSRCIQKAYLTDASAFYSSSMGTVILPNWYRIPELVLRHEAIHVNQDQLLDLSSIAGLRGFYSDSALALGSFLEGDASEREIELKEVNKDTRRDSVLPLDSKIQLQDPACDLPTSLRNLFHLQYQSGRRFWRKVRSTFPELSRKYILLHPPQTMREILHPEQYRKKPLERRNATINQKADYSKTLGEAIIGEIFNRGLNSHVSREAAYGVLADHISTEGKLLSWNILFNTPLDKTQFLDAVTLIREKDRLFFPGRFLQVSEREIQYQSLIEDEK